MGGVVRLFDLFGKEKIDPLWEYTAAGRIWHVRVASETLLLGENRDPETKRVEFFCLDQRDGSEVWRKGEFGDGWWIGIEGIFNGTLLLHGFSSPDLPVHRGIIAVDMADGTKLWERPDLVIQGTDGTNVVGHPFASSAEENLAISLSSGETLGVTGQLASEDFAAPGDDVEFPDVLEESSGVGAALRARITSFIEGREIAGPLMSYVRRDRIALSMHERRPDSEETEPHFRHSLRVLDMESGHMIFKQVLDEDIPRLVPDPFFVYHDNLYCIRERRTLMAVPFGVSRDRFPAP